MTSLTTEIIIVTLGWAARLALRAKLQAAVKTLARPDETAIGLPRSRIGSDDVTRYRVYDRRCHAYMGLSRRCAVCSMELGLFVRNFQASSNGSLAIARRQFLNALSLLSARSCEPEG